MVRVRASLSQLPAHVPGREQPGAVEPAGGEPAAPHRLTVTGPDRVPGRSRTPGHDVPASLSDVVRLPLGGDGGGSGGSGDFARHCAGGRVMVRTFPGGGVRVTMALAAQNDALPPLAPSRRG